MNALALDPAEARERVAEGATVLVGDPGDPVVFAVAAASRIDAARLEALQDLAGAAPVLGVGPAHADRLGLAPFARAPDRLGLAPCAPIDAALGLRGGWSLRDRARTMRTAAAVGGSPDDLSVPGHVTPTRIRADATPAAVAALELSRFAGRTTAVTLAPIGDRDGSPVTLGDADRIAALRRLPHVASLPLRALALAAAGDTVECALPTPAGTFRAVALESATALESAGSDPPCLALVHGDPAVAAAPCVRLHVRCPLGEALRLSACDCRARLDAALADVVAAGDGAVLYLRAGGDPLAALRGGCTGDSAVDLAPALALLAACGIPVPADLPTLLFAAS